MCICVGVGVYVYMCVCAYVYVCICMCDMGVCVYMCIYACMYIYIYTLTYIHTYMLRFHSKCMCEKNTCIEKFGRRKGNVLCTDALSTFHLWLYGIRHMVKDHSDNLRGNPLSPRHGLLFPISRKGFFNVSSQDRACHGSTMRDRCDNPSHHERILYHGKMFESLKAS